MVVIGRMIVYAAFEQRHIWIFWVCCIILGAAIILRCSRFSRSGATTCWRPSSGSGNGTDDHKIGKGVAPIARLSGRQRRKRRFAGAAFSARAAPR